VTRRQLLGLGGVALAALSGCGPSPSAVPPRRIEPTLPPLKKIDSLTELCAASQLRWLAVMRPREIASTAFLIPAVAKVVPEDNFNRFAETTGIDLRQATEALLAVYGGDAEGERSTLYLVRHAGDARRIERAFRQRLTSNEKRVVERPDLVRVSGKAALTVEAMTVIGKDLIAVQHGGSPSRGPARVAALYATEKLKKSPTALQEPALRTLHARLGAAPARAFARGPFEGELARGARGLLAGATAIGAAARPSAREGISFAVSVAGDFHESGEAASRELLEAWNDLAYGSFGHLLGLDQPVSDPLITHSREAVTVAVELHPGKLANGLRSATSAEIDAIMR
jgi:hypothetical protein